MYFYRFLWQLLLVFLVQNSLFFNKINILGQTPNLLFILMIIYSFRTKKLVYAFIIGLLLDIFNGVNFINCLIFPMIAYLINLFNNNYLKNELVLISLATFLATIFWGLSHYFIHFYLFKSLNVSFPLNNLLILSFWNFLIMPFMLKIIKVKY